MKTRGILFTAPNRATVDDLTIPDPGPGEVTIQTLYSVVSPGTEIRCLEGRQPNSLPFPFCPGYSMMGRIVGKGADVRLSEGDLVFCAGTEKASVNLQWGGHVGHVLASESKVFPIPAGVDPATAASTHLAAIGLRGVRLAKPTLYDTVAILGLGPIGQFSARLFATAAKTIAVDVIPERVTAAQHAGIRGVLATGDPADAVREFFPNGADIVVDATGAPTAVCAAIRAARDLPWIDCPLGGARVVIQGSYPDCLPIPYQDAFMKEISFLFPRSCQPSDIRLALELMSDGRLKAGDLISRVFSPDDAERAYQSLLNRDPNILTVAFQWAE